MRDNTAIFSKSGEHVATIGLNEKYGLWQIVIVQREELEFFCANKEVALCGVARRIRSRNPIPAANGRRATA